MQLHRIARRDKKAIFQVNNAKKQKKTIEWERLEIFSRKLEIPREHFLQRQAQRRTETVCLTKAEDIQKRWQEYTAEPYKKDPNDLDNHDSVISHLDRARYPGV